MVYNTYKYIYTSKTVVYARSRALLKQVYYYIHADDTMMCNYVTKELEKQRITETAILSRGAAEKKTTTP